jgi:hypothetical protein
MSTDRYRAPTEPDEDAYEDAWYRALKAKASRRFADPKDDTADAPPAPTFPPAPAQNEGDARAH